MDLLTISLTLGGLLLVLLAAGLWVALALMIAGLAAIFFMVPVPPGAVMATTVWGSINSWDLAALPMFIWMEEMNLFSPAGVHFKSITSRVPTLFSAELLKV